MSRRRKELDVLCVCSKCHLEHSRNERIRSVPIEGAEDKNVLCILTCPKCGCQKYTLVF